MTITIKKTVLLYLAVFLMTLLIGFLYLAQAHDIYTTEQTYEMTDHQIDQHNNKQQDDIQNEPNNLDKANTLVGTID